MALTFVTLFTFPLKAQEPSSSYFDSLTYRLYSEEQWEALSDAGANAISQGYDGYYIQIRTGIALFNRGRYRSADRYLTRAWEIFPNDVSGEYAYLSKLWGGRYFQSETIREKLPEAALKRLGIIKAPLIKSAGVSWATFWLSKNSTRGGVAPNAEESGSRLSANRFMHYGANFTHRLGSRGALTHQAGVLKKESDLYIGPSETNDKLWTDDYQANQFNYYLRWDGSLGQNWSMSLFGNGLWFDFPVYSPDDSSTDNNHSQWLQSKVNDFDFVAGATLIKSFDLADLSLEVAGSSIGSESQFQATGGALFYPLYNLNFYLGGGLIFNQSASEEQILGSGIIGGKLNRFVWLEAVGLLANEARFFHGQQGSLVYNGPELVNYIAGINAIVLPAKRFKWYISWQQRGYTSYFITDDDVVQLQQPLNNDYQLISTSVLWNF